MHQPKTPSLSQTIWPRWASRQFVTLPIVETLLPVTFAYSLSSRAVVMRQLKRWKTLWWRSLTRSSHKRTSMGPSRSCFNGTTSALQPEEITLKGTRVSCGWLTCSNFNIIENEFELQSRERHETPYPLYYELNSATAVLLPGWLWH